MYGQLNSTLKNRPVSLIRMVVIACMVLPQTVTLAQTVNGASPSKPDILVNFDVDNPNVKIFAELPGSGGNNSTSAYAEFTLEGTGSAYGTFEAHAKTDTEWANVDGWYVGYEGDLSSSFTAQGVRTNTGGVEGITSTFTTSQSLDVIGVGPLTYTNNGQTCTGGGLLVVGEAVAASESDTWVLGTGQMFETTGDSVTLTFYTQFEQRDADGFLLDTPISNEIEVKAEDGDTYKGTAETGSYGADTIGIQAQPGFGFAASVLSMEVATGTSFLTTDVSGYTDQIVGDTATWYTHPGYPGTP